MSSVTLLFGLTDTPLLAITNVINSVAAYVHVTGFWKLKLEVPFVVKLNKGIRKSNEIRSLLIFLAAGWAITGLMGLLGA